MRLLENLTRTGPAGPGNCSGAYERIRQLAYGSGFPRTLPVVSRSPRAPVWRVVTPRSLPAGGASRSYPTGPAEIHSRALLRELANSWRLFVADRQSPVRGSVRHPPTPTALDAPQPNPGPLAPAGGGRGAPLGSRLLRTPAGTARAGPLTALACCAAQLRARVQERAPIRRRAARDHTAAVGHHDAHVTALGRFNRRGRTLARDEVRESTLPLPSGHARAP